jgi:ArsR family transcriptional regulator
MTKVTAETLFKALADKTRLRTVLLLETHGELCVCELTQALQLSQPKVSRHLACLREAGLVSDRRNGLWVFYSIPSTLPAWVRQVLGAAVDGVADEPLFAGDLKRLRPMVDDALRCGAA